MKKIHYLLFACSLFLVVACDKGFEDLNKDPNSLTADGVEPAGIFTYAQLRTAQSKGEQTSNLYYCVPFVQHMASLSDIGIFNYYGDKYVYHKDDNEVLWKKTYGDFAGPNCDKLLVDVLQLTKDKPEYFNLYQMARIWRTVIYTRLTDMYGDVPYSEASLGYYQNIYKPKYDTQKDIYYGMLSELEDATAKLDANEASIGEADIAYKGSVAQWKKFGYSMILRLGMRLSKVEPSTAEAWVKKAYAGGVFTANTDNMRIKMTDAKGAVEDLCNGDSWLFSFKQPIPGKISKTFLDFLKNNGDPRLTYTVAVYTDPTDVSTKNTDPAIQKGLPNGLNATTVLTDLSYDSSNPAGVHQYSAVNFDVYGKLDGIRMFLTCAEVKFMLAEACVRGWISGDAKTFYDEGVHAAMKHLAMYDASAVISDTEINNYLAAHPFVGTADVGKALEQINTQYWAATFMNGYEAYANVRRSGYPVLTPVNYPDNETHGTYPRRLRYPNDEPVYNLDNYKEAVARQGADSYTTRVWWDKE